MAAPVQTGEELAQEIQAMAMRLKSLDASLYARLLGDLLSDLQDSAPSAPGRTIGSLKGNPLWDLYEASVTEERDRERAAADTHE